MGDVAQAVLIGMLIMLAGTIPRNLLFAANLQLYPQIPWAVPLSAVYLYIFWRCVQGSCASATTAKQLKANLRANRISARTWMWSLTAGGLGIVALVLALRILNRLVVLPQQRLPDLSAVPPVTIVALLLMGAPIAGIVEEAAFRGHMQRPIEQKWGIAPAILITGTMFAIAHLDFTPILWPYYVAVAAIYGTVTYLADSILPAIVLHTAGNTYSNLDLWFRGHAEWQAKPSLDSLIWKTGADSSFWILMASLFLVSVAALAAYIALADSNPAPSRVSRTPLPGT